jgi:hypothetical protein
MLISYKARGAMLDPESSVSIYCTLPKGLRTYIARSQRKENL